MVNYRESADEATAILPAGTVTLLFTDIEGSTRLIQRAPQRYPDLLADHRRLLRRAFGAHGGHELGTEGDAFSVAFGRAADALAAAIAGQRALGEWSWPEGLEVRVRMGLHTGEPALTGEGYVGVAMHRAARICSAGHGGQILMSHATRELVEGEIGGEFALEDLGEHRLKDLDRPERLFQVVGPGLVTAPPRSTDRRPRRWAGPAAPPNPTIGRDDDVRAVAERVRSTSGRLVTLVGPGGVGKTRLATEVARAVVAGFADGACFVSLAAVHRAQDIPAAILQALAIDPLPGESPGEAIERFLAAKELLLVLDNCEHLLDGAPLAGRLLESAPGLTVLATSREALGLHAEECYRLGPLAERPAGELFAARVRARDAAINVAADAPAVRTICERLDRLPLAIELAAARCGILSPAEIAERLDAALSGPAPGRRDAPARHQTLRATIDWSHELLTDDERRCFARFAVFRGGATVDAAQAVTAAGLDTLDSLVAKHLLIRQSPGQPPTRLRMLQTIGAYAAERLAEAPDAEAVRQRHFDLYLRLARDHGDPRAIDGEQADRHLACLDAEQGNLRAALRWATERRDGDRSLALVDALGWYLLRRHQFAELVSWADQALELAPRGPTALVGRVLRLKAECLWPLGRTAEEADVMDRAMSIADETGDLVLASRLHRLRSSVALRSDLLAEADAHAAAAIRAAAAAGDGWELASSNADRALAAQSLEELRRRVDEAVELLDASGHVAGSGRLLQSAAYAALYMDSPDHARRLLERALPRLQRLGSPMAWMVYHGNLGLAALLSGDADAARAALVEELRLARELVIHPGAQEALRGLAAVAALEGDDDRAARLAGAAWGHDWGMPQDRVSTYLRDRYLEPAHARLGTEAWNAAHAFGRGLGLPEAIAFGLGDHPRAGESIRPPDGRSAERRAPR